MLGSTGRRWSRNAPGGLSELQVFQRGRDRPKNNHRASEASHNQDNSENIYTMVGDLGRPRRFPMVSSQSGELPEAIQVF